MSTLRRPEKLGYTWELPVSFRGLACEETAGEVHRLVSMDLSKALATVFIEPAKIGLAAADASLAAASVGVGLARKALGEAGEPRPASIVNLLGIDATIDKANRLARLLDDDTPLGRALAPGGPIEQLMRPGGPMDRLTEQGGALERAVAPGGLIDELLAEEGLVDRLLSEDGLAERLMAKGGLIDMLTAHNGPLDQIAFAAETLNRLTPNLEALSPTIDMLRDAVDSLSAMGNPLTNIADRFTLRSRSRRSRPLPPQVASGERIVAEDDDR